MVTVIAGQGPGDDGLGSRLPSVLDPTDEPWLSMTGSESLGPDWGVALAGNTMLLGAPELGAVLIFDLEGREAGALGGQALVIPEVVDDHEGSRMGAALLTLDLDGDDRRELVVAAPGGRGVDDSVEAGRLYVFDASGHFDRPLYDTGVAQQLGTDDAAFTALGVDAYDQAGSVLSACGDLDGDGLPELAMSTPWSEIGGAALGGSVSVLSSKEMAELRSEGATSASIHTLGPTYALDQLGGAAGAAIRCDVDLDHDSLPELVVGAPYADSEEDEAAGAVYIIPGSRVAEDIDTEGEVHHLLGDRATAMIWGPTDNAYLGASLALGDVAGDSQPDLLVGAPGGGRERGLAVLYADLSHEEDCCESTLRFVGEDAGDHFGSAVELADLDGDRLDEIVVGAPRHNPTGDEEHFAAGAVYVWYGETSFRTWSTTSSAGKADATIVRQQAWLLTGDSIASGDMNGDGLAELVLVHRILPNF